MTPGKITAANMGVLHAVESPAETIERQRRHIEQQKDIILAMEGVVRFHEPTHPSLEKLSRLRRRQ